MRTTLDLPDETFRQLKAPAPAQQYRPLPVAIERASYPIPIAREADGTVTPYLSNAQLYAMLDEEDLANEQRVLNQVPGQ